MRVYRRSTGAHAQRSARLNIFAGGGGDQRRDWSFPQPGLTRHRPPPGVMGLELGDDGAEAEPQVGEVVLVVAVLADRRKAGYSSRNSLTGVREGAR